jgi:gamma-glutamyltranspeptidase/glutathione hydrolase
MKKYLFLLVIFSSVLSCNSSRKNKSAAVSVDPYKYSVQKTITCSNGAVVSAHPLASKIGVEI